MPGERFNVFMDSDLKKRLKKAAIDEGKSASQIISELVELYLKDDSIVRKEVINKRRNNIDEKF